VSQDLRDFLKELDENGEISHVSEKVKRDYEISTFMMELEKKHQFPVMWFDDVEDSEFPVVTNILGTKDRFARGMGVEVSQVSEAFGEKIKNRFDDLKIIENPPCNANFIEGDDVDLTKLPILKHFPIDAAPYITSGLCVAKDPETGAETLGYHRLQLKGKNKLGISFHSRQRMWEYFRRSEERGENMKAAICIGVHPNISLGSQASVPYHLGKFGAIGGLFGQALEVSPCKTIDLNVPTYAEFVLEGEVLANVREPEGPFAEYTNYACFRSTENVFQVNAIRYREKAIFHDITPAMSSEHITIVSIQREGDIEKFLKQNLPNIKAVHSPLSSCGIFHCYVSMKKTAEGQAQQVILTTLGMDHHIKMVVVVDEDVDVFNEQEVLWAMATRLQADRGVMVFPNMMGETLDPSTDELSRTAKMGIDATKPLSGFSPKIDIDENVIGDVQRLFKYVK
jgi:UbiD family decarboxylase